MLTIEMTYTHDSFPETDNAVNNGPVLAGIFSIAFIVERFLLARERGDVRGVVEPREADVPVALVAGEVAEREHAAVGRECGLHGRVVARRDGQSDTGFRQLRGPRNRQDVRTFVKEWDEKLIKEIILREVRRGGQIFYVHNSIEHMPLKLGELKAILPDLRIVMLHSKISAAETEKELLKFEAGEYDLLLATSIVESGIHMPRVNTIIVDGADRFGIADLHQLRGRVGRSNIEGFAYFLVDSKEHLTDEAKKRLLALESNSFLGSGSVLAHHDLEIRGGGNLIGDAQSGHIKNIGYSLYLRMLEDAIRELTNNTKPKERKVEIKLSISAYISSDVVSEDRLRLDLYRRLSQAKEVQHIYEIEEEIIDRFGELDTPTKQFVELVTIKLLALQRGVKSIMNYGQNITIVFEDEKKESIKSASKDDDDIIDTVLKYLRKG